MAKKQGIDFSAVSVDTLTFTAPNGRAYELRDDVPMEVIAEAALTLDDLAETQEIAKRAESGEDKAAVKSVFRAEFARVRGEVLYALLRIMQHSMPEVSEDEIAADFSLEQQVQIINFFIDLLSKRYSAAQNSTPATAEKGKATRRK